MKLFYIDDVRMPTERAHGYQIAKMCEAFARQGLSVSLIVPGRRNPGRSNAFDFYGLERNFEIIYLPVVDLPWISLIPNLIRTTSFLFNVHKNIKKEIANEDIVFTRTFGVAWLFKKHPNVFYEIHKIDRYLSPWRKAIYPRRFVVITSYLKNILHGKGIPDSRIIFASDAVDLKNFQNLPSKSAAREKLKLPEKRIIGYVGRFKTLGQEKGLPTLILAAKEVLKLNKDVLFLFVGGPLDAAERYLDLVDSLGLNRENFLFVDRVSVQEVPLWLAACDILAMPWPRTDHYSYFMSPLKMFEYMAAERPIISSDLPAIRDVLNENNSVLVEPDNYNALADGIKKLLNNRNFSEKLAGRARADVEGLTWDKRASIILDNG